LGPNLKASPDKVLTVGGYASGEVKLSLTDGLVSLKGDVSTDHVEEKDTQGPDG
jgi:hypothetical protein